MQGDTLTLFDISSYNASSWSWSIPGSNIPTSIQQNPGNISYANVGIYPVTLIASNSQGNDTLTKSCYIEVLPGIGINPISGNVPAEFSLEQNFPNPFNPVTRIRFSIPLLIGVSEGRNVLLKVYDILGKEVSTLVNEELSPGTYEVEFDGTNYSSGIYFYMLSIGKNTFVNKMLLVK